MEGTVDPCLGSSRVPVPESQQTSRPLCKERGWGVWGRPPTWGHFLPARLKLEPAKCIPLGVTPGKTAVFFGRS